ncbi:hypothetical protein Rhopal_004171-T1 [Rhodotorula paludigena]|uniref:Pumilio homology domain family member 3 n=1 Tax=Rhodotorula paludigena TaxID=86838 RepID=A0AAV5GLR4_9BASI|nr:hypothetical protein Rhopal_004171-T1 [Rhodotorula paludigena]
MDSARASPAPPGAIPPRLGLPRRSSFDPHSSTTKGSLSLGSLPPPTFGNLPAGLRSVPAIESSRHFGSAFRNNAALGDGQRTPGGSLVIGAEVFGFGKYAPKETTRRHNGGGGSVDGLDDSRLSSDWPSDFGARAAASSDDLRLRDETRGLQRLSGDFASNLSRPQLKTAGSAIDLRPSSPATMADSLRAPSRSSLLPPTSSLAQSTPDSSNETSPDGSNGAASTDPTTAASVSLNASTPAATDEAPSPSSNPYVYPFQPPDPSPPPLGNPYFAHPSALGMSPPGAGYAPRNGRPGEGPYSFGQAGVNAAAAEDELAFGMRGMSLGGAAMGVQAGARAALRSPYSPEPYSAALPGTGAPTGREPPTRQNSTGYAPAQGFYLPPGSPYVGHQDPYSPVSFAQPSFYSPMPDGGGPSAPGSRRDSTVPNWGLPMPPFALPPDFAQSPSNAPSRQGSFSYTPSGLPGQPGGGPMSPYVAAPPPPGPPVTYGSSHLDAASSPGGHYASAPPHVHQHAGGYPVGPQLGQQHQIILGRAVRGMEYVAPGPVQPHGYGTGYGPDMRTLRSPLLEEFRSNRNRSWELPDLMGHIVEFSGDQLGSRHIQTKLDTATNEDKAIVFQEILPNMLQLSTDVFANYVIQKFFEQGSQVQKTAMAKVLEGHVLQLSLQMYGCRVVQKALEYVLVDQQVRLVKELDGHVLKCAKDAQSNHVIQRALERVPPEHLHFITDACLGQVHPLATHPYGCRVLQRIFENCPAQQTRALLDELHRYTQTLIQDQYGNYVVQWVIEKGETADRSLVVAKIYGQLLSLAQQKFASNVVEKCILHSTDDERRRLIDEVLQTGADGSSVIKAMLVHPYANYVMQKCLHCAAGAQREKLFAETTVQLTNLRKYSTPYSKHLITIEKLLASERERQGLPPLGFGGPLNGNGGLGHHPLPHAY